MVRFLPGVASLGLRLVDIPSLLLPRPTTCSYIQAGTYIRCCLCKDVAVVRASFDPMVQTTNSI